MAASTGNQIADYLYEIMTEELPKEVDDQLPEIDTLFQNVFETSEGVRAGGGLSRSAVNAGGTLLKSATWIYQWIMRASGGGLHVGSNPSPDLFLNLSSHHARAQQNAGFPPDSHYVMPKLINPFVGLAEVRGTIALPFQLFDANELDPLSIDIVDACLESSRDLASYSEAICMHSRNPDLAEVVRSYAHVCTGAANVHPAVVNADIDGSTATNRISFRRISDVSPISEEDSIARLRPGATVEVFRLHYDLNGTPANSTIEVLQMAADIADGTQKYFVVEPFDFLDEQFSLVTLSGQAVAAATSPAEDTAAPVAAGDVITFIVTLRDYATLQKGVHATGPTSTVSSTISDKFAAAGNDVAYQAAFDFALRSSRWTGTPMIGKAYGTDGIFSWLKTELSDSLYGVSIKDMPTLKSLKFDNINDFFTDRYFRDGFTWAKSQWGMKFMPDTVIMSPGVENGIITSLTSPTAASSNMEQVRWIQNRETKGGQIQLGFEKVGYKTHGITFESITSPFFMRRRVLACQTNGQNLRRLIPPAGAQSGTEAGMSGYRFMAKFYGSANNRLPTRTSTGALGDLGSSPYVAQRQYFMRNPRMVLWTGVRESTGRNNPGI